MSSVQPVQLSPKEALESIVSRLDLGVSDVARSLTFEILVSEYMRSWLTPIAGPAASVRVLPRSQLLSHVRSQLGQFYELLTSTGNIIGSKSGFDVIEHVYKRLRDVRDIAELPGRLVQLSPLRLVSLPGDERLLVGGGDCNTLRHAAGIRCDFYAFVRSMRIAGDDASSSVHMPPLQDLHSWCGIPKISLAEWGAIILQRAARDLLPGGGGEDAIKIYQPTKSSKASSHRRWLPLSSLSRVEAKLYLLRREGPRSQYFLARLRPSPSGIIVHKQCQLATASARRLQFALDVEYDSRMRATIESEGHLCQLRLPAWLPTEEERVVRALQIQEDTVTLRRERALLFDRRWIPTLEVLLDGLGVSLSAV